MEGGAWRPGSSLTPLLRASASDVHFPSAPASQTDSLPRQGSNFQNKTFSTKENITVRRKTFQYHASWDPRKCTEHLSGSGAVLAPQALLRTAGEQWLAPGTSQAEWPTRAPGWSSSCPGLERIECVSTVMPQSGPHRGRPNIPQDRGLELSHTNPSTSLPAQGRCPRQACCLAEGLLASLLGSGKWLMENIPQFTIVPPGVVQCLDPSQGTPGKGW